MILTEIQNYLKNNGQETDLLEMKSRDCCALLYKGGPAHKPGPRRKPTVNHISVYCRGADFSNTLIRANRVYSLLHYPGMLKTVETENKVIFSSECLSLPAYNGTDRNMRHVFVFDVLIKSIDKE